MKRLITSLILITLACSLFAAGKKEAATPEQWPDGAVTVICPWAVGGVADIVNRKMATYGQEVLGQPVLATNELGAGGNVALTNYLQNQANSLNLILGGEGAFSIAPNTPGSEALVFTYDDYEPIINLYSSIFVMTADAKLGIKDLDALKAYGADKTLKVAVNGVAGSEAFLAKALFKELGLKLELVSYNGANLALDAASKGETQFAISHQSQAQASVEAGTLTPVVAFDKEGLKFGVFAGVKGVGEYGYNAYFRNRCFLLARKGTDPAIIQKVSNAYLKILAKDDITELFKTMLIEIDPLDPAAMDQHVADVIQIVKANQ